MPNKKIKAKTDKSHLEIIEEKYGKDQGYPLTDKNIQKLKKELIEKGYGSLVKLLRL